MYMGASDAFIGARDPIDVEDEAWGIEMEAEVAVFTDDVPAGLKPDQAEGHIKLVETLAERIADLAMAHAMVRVVTVRVEKPEAIEEAAAAGVEITRRKSQ